MNFVIGQRWISESENELGLGKVSAVDFRTVSIYFPAANEQRVYAIQNAPLIRVQFRQGEIITHNDGWQAKILDVFEKQDLMFYLVKRDEQEIVLNESELSHQISFSRAQDKLFALQVDRNDRFALRYRTLQQQQAQFQSPLRGLRGIRAGLISHQLHIAQDVGQRIHPRVLLADEVGLGKTIEAGMILQQQLFSGRVNRALIIVPETLQHQWLVEMLRRFNLHFSLFDEERAQDFALNGENPFESENLILCALQWLMTQPTRAKQLQNAQFDLLIVDEAHHLHWNSEAPSAEYAFIAQLTKQIPAVLLLTATPEQLGQAGHFARLHLLDPNRFHNYEHFLAEQQQYQPIADAVQHLLDDSQAISPSQKRDIAQLLDYPTIDNLPREQLIRELIDRHGTGRILFRNTRQGVQGFPTRHYHPIELAQTTQNGKVEWLLNFLKQNTMEKVLVLCQTAETVLQLAQFLRDKEAMRCAVFHQNMSILERDRAAAYFAQQENGAQVLLSSSIGSEGRNFQFASHLVLFDLPAHPDLLEQCIGRLDRIGQTRDVQIFVPYFRHSADAYLARWYHEGLNAFIESCPMGDTLFAKYRPQLHTVLQQAYDENAFGQLILDTQNERIALKQILEQGRDRLLEINSRGGEAAERLSYAIAAQDGSPELVNFALNLFDVIGVEQEDLGENAIVIHPTGHMLVPNFPGLKEEGITVTFSRDLALAREELEFLSWDHPMIRNGIDLIYGSDIGKTACAFLQNSALPTGTLLLELIYLIESQAPKNLQLTRFLPPTPVRLLLDIKGNNLADRVAFEKLEKQLAIMDKATSRKVIKMVQSHLEQMLQYAEQKIASIAENLIAQAQVQAEQVLSQELHRLQSLQQINKNIRTDEIALLVEQQQQTQVYLQQANWRLDSLRVLISKN